MEEIWNVGATPPTGGGRRLELVGIDLIFGGIDNLFVYPTLDVRRVKEALSVTLSSWPILTGRVQEENDRYFLHFSDHSVPLSYAENTELQSWPDLPVVVEDPRDIQPFIDSVRYQPDVEPLLRLKITRLVRSEEYLLGVSFSHLLGDADSNLHFLRDLSRVYQGLELSVPRPIFDRHRLSEEDPHFSSSAVMKQYRLADRRASVLARLTKEQSETDPVHLTFSSRELRRLHESVNDAEVTVHDVLCAHIILSLNQSFFSSKDEFIHRAQLLVNFRGVDESLARPGQVSNSIMSMLTSDFVDCLSLKSIAQSIRQAVIQTRDERFLRRWVSTSDVLSRKMIREGRVNFVWDDDEVIFNSNYKYDWTEEVNFGQKNECRFHTLGLYRFYFRIFRVNRREGRGEEGGAEVSFRLPRGEAKAKFLAYHRLTG